MTKPAFFTLGRGEHAIKVSNIGLGCEACSAKHHFSDNDAVQFIVNAVNRHGVTFLDTADMYGGGNKGTDTQVKGPTHNEKLVGQALQRVDRQKIILATKAGVHITKWTLDSSPGYIRNALIDSLKRLQTDYVDLFFMHFVDTETYTIEAIMQTLVGFKNEGLIKHIGLSNIDDPNLIRRAHAVHPLTAVENECSPWARKHVIDNGVLDICRELSIGFIAYSPLARSFLASTRYNHAFFGALPQDDFRHIVPRFQNEHLPASIEFQQRLKAIADQKGCTLA